jgi:polysaccharide biosynthesis protein PelF
MSENKRFSVLFETEGTYPYLSGGVSSWCYTLIKSMKDVDFHVISVVGNQNVEILYDIPENVKNLYMVPLWNIEEPFGYTNGYSLNDALKKKTQTTEHIIERDFIPLFLQFLEGIENKNVDLYDYATLFEKMNTYFEKYDYSITMFSKPVWNKFKDTIYQKYIKYNLIFSNDELPTVYDLITCMRWLFHLLMVLDIPIPKTDLVHSSIAAFTSLPGIISKVRYGTPILLTEHGVYLRERYFAISTSNIPYFSKRFLINLISLISRLSYEMADQISPVCKFNSIWEKRLGVDENKIKVIYNGIDPDVFVPLPKPQNFINVPTVIIVGKLIPIKDFETAIKTAKIVKEKIPNVLFLQYGTVDEDPDYARKCEKLVKSLDLEDTFLFMGLKLNNPYEIYNQGDVTLLSSVSEGHPYAILESLSCERPVIATDVGGVPEVLEGFGLIVQPKNHIAMAQAVIELLNDNNLRAELGKKGRERVKKHFNINDAIEQYKATYDLLINGIKFYNPEKMEGSTLLLKSFIRNLRNIRKENDTNNRRTQ